MNSKFTFFASFDDVLSDMTDEQYGRMVRAMSAYVFRGEETTFNDKAEIIIWKLVKPILDNSLILSSRRSEAGKKGGESGRGVSRNQGNQNASKQKQINSKSIADYPNMDMDREEEVDKEEDLDKDKGKKKKSSRFTPPTVEEVQAYCLERGNGIDAQHFIDFYTTRGWKYGNTAIRDWKACIRTWEQRNGYTPAKGKAQKNVKLGVGEWIDKDGKRRYGTGNLPPVPIDAPPRPDNDSYFSAETMTWIPFGI